MSENNNFKIAEDIAAAYEERVKMIQGIAGESWNLLAEFGKRRERMSQELKEVLVKYRSLRKSDFDKMMEDIFNTQTEREENVKKMLTDFQEQEMAVVQNFKKMLGRGRELRLKDFKKTLSKIKGEYGVRQKDTAHNVSEELTRMRTEVREMLDNFKKEREKTAAEWKRKATLMAPKREVK